MSNEPADLIPVPGDVRQHIMHSPTRARFTAANVFVLRDYDSSMGLFRVIGGVPQVMFDRDSRLPDYRPRAAQYLAEHANTKYWPDVASYLETHYNNESEK